MCKNKCMINIVYMYMVYMYMVNSLLFIESEKCHHNKASNNNTINHSLNEYRKSH